MTNEFISSVVQGVESTQLSPQVRAVQGVPATTQTGKDKAAGGTNLPPTSGSDPQQAVALEEAVSKVSDFVQNYQRNLQFSVDGDSGRTIIKVVDAETEEVIREIPPEHVIKLARRLNSPDSLILEGQA